MTRTDRVVEWVIWHAVELVAVGAPVAAALWWSLWFAPLAAVACAVWVVHERRSATDARSRRELTAGESTVDSGVVVERGQDVRGRSAS